jgi:tetratricopeptide (TPR) repeat protein
MKTSAKLFCMKIILIILSIVLSGSFAFSQENTYFTQEHFVKYFGQEMVKADEAFQEMVKNGLKELSLSKVEFRFISDKPYKLDSLKKMIQTTYPFVTGEVKKTGLEYEIQIITNEIPITSDNLLYLVLDMYKRGYEFDAKPGSYAGVFDSKNQRFPDLNKLKEEAYFNEGMECYLKGDLSGAIIKWTLTISINPEDPNAYYSRAVVKDALFTWKAALKDYDKALELAPGFVGALINRGNLKLENGDNEGALDDYNRVLTLEQNDREIITSIYFNRGNAKYLLGNKTGACEDWTRATEFGADYAQERIEEYCR